MSTIIIEHRQIPASFFSETLTDDPPDDGPELDDPGAYEMDAGQLLATEMREGNVPRAHLDTAAPADAGGGSFLFWSLAVAGEARPLSDTSDFPTASAKVVLAFDDTERDESAVYTLTAWYLPPSRGGPGEGLPRVFARAFSIDANAFFRRTPIASVSPAGAWLGGNHHVVSTERGDADGRVVISPVELLHVQRIGSGPIIEKAAGQFQRWVGRKHFEPTGDPRKPFRAIDDTDYVARVGSSSLAIAAYRGAVHVVLPLPPLLGWLFPGCAGDLARHIQGPIAAPTEAEIARLGAVLESLPATELPAAQALALALAHRTRAFAALLERRIAAQRG